MTSVTQDQIKHLTREQNEKRKHQIKPSHVVRCKEHPENGFMFWNESTSFIYHKCKCGVICGVGGNASVPPAWEHLDKFEIILPKAQRTGWDVLWDEAQRRIEADPEKFKVEW